MRNNEKGITLVALVVTIIVLLILAGITITFALNGGILDRATQAREATEIASIRDYAGFAKLNVMTEHTLAKNGVDSKIDITTGTPVSVQSFIEKEFKGTGFTVKNATEAIFTPSTGTWAETLLNVESTSSKNTYTVNMNTLAVEKQK